MSWYAVEETPAPQWAAEDLSEVTLWVVWEEGAAPVEFVASAADTDPDGVDLWIRAIAGEFGEIADFDVGSVITPDLSWVDLMAQAVAQTIVAFGVVGEPIQLHFGQTGRDLLEKETPDLARTVLEVPHAGPAPNLTNVTADFNTDLPSGWYTVAGTISNGPNGSTSYSGVMLVIQRYFQFARSTQFLYLSGALWVRYGTMLSTAPVWGSWVKIAGTTGSDTIATTGKLIAGATESVEVGGSAMTAQVHAAGSVGMSIARWSADIYAPDLRLAKSRAAAVGGSAAVQSGDTIGTLSWFADAGAGPSAYAALIRAYADGAPSGGGVPGRLMFSTTAAGDTTPTERMRISSAGDVQMGGANTVISAARHFLLRSYTVATLPSASPAAQMIYVSNGTSNKRLAVSDGTNWRWPDGAIVS